MDNSNLKIAQQDVEEALKAVEEMEKYIHTDSPSKEQLKETIDINISLKDGKVDGKFIPANEVDKK